MGSADSFIDVLSLSCQFVIEGIIYVCLLILYGTMAAADFARRFLTFVMFRLRFTHLWLNEQYIIYRRLMVTSFKHRNEIMPYASQLAPYVPQILPKVGSLSEHVEVIMPAMAPHLGDVIPYFPVIMPYFDLLTQHLGTVSPYLPKILPQMNVLMPHVDKFLPHFEKVLPYLPHIMPHLDTLMPHVPALVPYVDKLMPNIDIYMPYTDKMMPYLPKFVPYFPEIIPYLDDVAPYLDDLAPHFDTLMPHIDAFLPHLGAMLPHIVPALPSLIPLLDKFMPHMDLLLPHMDKLLPHLDIMLPYLDKILPHMNLFVAQLDAMPAIPGMERFMNVMRIVARRKRKDSLSVATASMTKKEKKGKKEKEKEKEKEKKKETPEKGSAFARFRPKRFRVKSPSAVSESPSVEVTDDEGSTSAEHLQVQPLVQSDSALVTQAALASPVNQQQPATAGKSLTPPPVFRASSPTTMQSHSMKLLRLSKESRKEKKQNKEKEKKEKKAAREKEKGRNGKEKGGDKDSTKRVRHKSMIVERTPVSENGDSTAASVTPTNVGEPATSAAKAKDTDARKEISRTSPTPRKVLRRSTSTGVETRGASSSKPAPQQDLVYITHPPLGVRNSGPLVTKNGDDRREPKQQPPYQYQSPLSHPEQSAFPLAQPQQYQSAPPRASTQQQQLQQQQYDEDERDEDLGYEELVGDETLFEGDYRLHGALVSTDSIPYQQQKVGMRARLKKRLSREIKNGRSFTGLRRPSKDSGSPTKSGASTSPPKG